MKALIVGSGITGSTAARILADHGHSITLCERREELGGNCADEWQNGVEMHKYGPHLFHTSDEEVWNFLARFTNWTNYEHHVVADTTLGRINIPYNEETASRIGRHLGDNEIRDLIFRKYSEKQWGMSWEDLPSSITSRVPLRRKNRDCRYFTDTYQGQPSDGYSRLFQEMTTGIEVRFVKNVNSWRSLATDADLVVYTGKLDEYFNYQLGRLPYRSLLFSHDWEKQIGFAQINQCNSNEHTREYEHSFFCAHYQRIFVRYKRDAM